jgi:enoyl-CoA hydratase
MQSASTPEQGPPLLLIDGACATIRLNRPREHNRMDPADLPVLVSHFAAVEANPAIRVLVITGTGEKTFSSGYTLTALTEFGKEGVTFPAMVDRLEEVAVPTICAMNGSVYGGATDLALACDFRIGVTGTRFVMPASRIGLHYYPGGMRRYVERLGVSAAKRLFLLGQPTPAEDLDRIGFFDRLVSLEEFEVAVDAMVDMLADGAPTVIQSMKKHLNLIARGEYHPSAIEAAQEVSVRSEDLREGLAAMHEKRKPRFTGK